MEGVRVRVVEGEVLPLWLPLCSVVRDEDGLLDWDGENVAESDGEGWAEADTVADSVLGVGLGEGETVRNVWVWVLVCETDREGVGEGVTVKEDRVGVTRDREGLDETEVWDALRLSQAEGEAVADGESEWVSEEVVLR